jgi:gluconate 5-dehydrogenase
MSVGAPPFTLDGQTALISGGGSGIGLGIARCFVEAGARVALIGRREPPLQAAALELGHDTIYEPCDITVPDDVERMAGRVEQRLGQVSILINNAGIHQKKRALESTEQELRGMLETHVVGAFALSRRFGPAMLSSGAGSILFIGSMAAVLGIPGVAGYSAAKAACLGLVRALAAEFSPHGVRVNGIQPGWIQTDMLRKALNGDQPRRDRILGRTPLQRFGTVRDIGWAAVYLCSPAGNFVNGSVLTVDGGASIGF